MVGRNAMKVFAVHLQATPGSRLQHKFYVVPKRLKKEEVVERLLYGYEDLEKNVV